MNPTTDPKILTAYVNGYLEAALFCATVPGSNGDPLDREGYSVRDFTGAAQVTALADVTAFLAVPGVAEILERYDDAEDIGRNLYLTANGHGAGFWDGDYEAEAGDGDALTKAARNVPGRDAYPETDEDLTLE